MLAPDAAAEVADDELEAPEWVMDEDPPTMSTSRCGR